MENTHTHLFHGNQYPTNVCVCVCVIFSILCYIIKPSVNDLWYSNCLLELHEVRGSCHPKLLCDTALSHGQPQPCLMVSPGLDSLKAELPTQLIQFDRHNWTPRVPQKLLSKDAQFKKKMRFKYHANNIVCSLDFLCPYSNKRTILFPPPKLHSRLF